MTPTDVFQVAGAVVLSLGGGAALVVGLSSRLGKVWVNRILEADKARYAHDLEVIKSRFVADTEKYKTSLKKSEFMFQKEYEAASEFVAILRSIRPTFAHPDMDWYDACDEIARSFDAHENTLERFLTKHGAVLSEPVRDLLGKCIGTASEGKFHVGAGDELDPQVNRMASTFYDEAQAVEAALLETVRGQSRI